MRKIHDETTKLYVRSGDHLVHLPVAACPSSLPEFTLPVRIEWETSAERQFTDDELADMERVE
jgi:hypothetical protein